MRAADTPGHRGDGSGSSQGILSSVGRDSKSGEKESTGTMQLLDRLGYGLVSLSPSPGTSGEGKSKGLAHSAQKNEESSGEEPYSAPVRGMDLAAADTT